MKLPKPTLSTRVRRLLARLWTQVRPRPKWWLGTPYRATIAPAARGGYVLKIHHTQGTEWVKLPPRTRVYDRPDERAFAAAAEALAARRLAWVLPWELNGNGDLTAAVTDLNREEHRR